MILVVGPTGQFGSELCRQLTAKGVAFRALVRTRAKASMPHLEAPGVEVVFGDLAEPATLDAALVGVDHVFLTSSNASQQTRELQKNLVSAAKRASVEHVVKISSIGAGPDAPTQNARWHYEIETALEQSGVGFTHLRPTQCSNNLLALAMIIRMMGVINLPLGEARISFLDHRDVAAVAAHVLTEPGHMGKAYLLTGPRAITCGEIAEMLSAATGKSIRYEPIALEQYGMFLSTVGVPDWARDALLEDYDFLAKGGSAVVSPAVREITGRDARPFEEFARDYARDFGRDA